jgi:hypothetical protein
LAHRPRRTGSDACRVATRSACGTPLSPPVGRHSGTAGPVLQRRSLAEKMRETSRRHRPKWTRASTPTPCSDDVVGGDVRPNEAARRLGSVVGTVGTLGARSHSDGFGTPSRNPVTRRDKRTGVAGCEHLPRLAKLGVTGSSPVPRISEKPAKAGSGRRLRRERSSATSTGISSSAL